MSAARFCFPSAAALSCVQHLVSSRPRPSAVASPAARRTSLRQARSAVISWLSSRPSFVVEPFLLDGWCVSVSGPPSNRSRRRRNALRSVSRSFDTRPATSSPSLRPPVPAPFHAARYPDLETTQSLQQSRPSLIACHPGPRTARVPQSLSPWTSTRYYRRQTRPRKPPRRRRRTMPRRRCWQRSRRASAPSASRCPRELPQD